MSGTFAPHILTRKPQAGGGKRASVPLFGDLSLEAGRVHELCGSARRTLALSIAGRTRGPVFWIAPGWASARPNPEGMLRFVDPGRLLFLAPPRAEDLLWTAEEALRAGIVPLVIADLPEPPALTPIRRLQLAAEAGAATAGRAPLGLILTPGAGGAAGVESRWSFEPRHGPQERMAGDEGWELHRLRARTAPEARWSVRAARDGGLEPRPARAAPPITQK